MFFLKIILIGFKRVINEVEEGFIISSETQTTRFINL